MREVGKRKPKDMSEWMYGPMNGQMGGSVGELVRNRRS